MNIVNKEKENYSETLITRVTPRLKALLEVEAGLAGVKPSAYTRKVLEASCGGSRSATPRFIRAYDLMYVRAELRRQGSLIKELVEEHDAPADALMPLVAEFARLIGQIDKEFCIYE